MASSSSLTPSLTAESMEKKVTETMDKPISELKKDEVEKECVEVADKEKEKSVEEAVKDKDLEVFNASDSIDEAREKETEPFNVLKDGSLDQVKEMETVSADVEIESKQDSLVEKAKEISAPKVEENCERNEVTEVEFQEKTVETSKDLVSEESLTLEEVKEKEVNVKAKNSSNIISKVKQSFVKAKKAIIGKSLSSKTISSEAKDEIKV